MRGGEIFVPKIPSMKIVDVAECMGPGLPHEVVGIRPGEKLHEVMVPEDDSRTTVEIDDRYIVLPAFTDGPFKEWVARGARPVAPEFRYASDSNDEWLSTKELAGMVREL
jgi:UDP-N-acetylglucosamine 4,6-dehydratase/5-epimerase